ncbi:MAG: tripartite tricarboxylate transporter substrate binding protein [Comamonas sp.]|uniref:tripartite tricarboxylate transporter substrate binding protein n=1 Tax=Comamonas sp. TaxID=34028 RepID=UPI002FC730E5
MTSRRTFTAACVAGALLAPAMAWAQAGYPKGPVKMVVPYAAGGATDIIARTLGDKLGAKWGQPVVIENKPGAGTTLAASQLARMAADGQTLYMTTSAHTIAGSIYSKLDFDPVKDFSPISLVAKVPLVLVVRPGLAATNLQEFIALAKKEQSALSFASPGNGTAQHLAGEMFNTAVQARTTHVPYRGDAPAITDLLGGSVDAMYATLTVVLPYIASGKLRAIALANDKRVQKVPNIPTFAEAGLDKFEAATWFGVLAPARIAAPLGERISQDIKAVIAQPDMQAKLIDLGAEIVANSPAEFRGFMDEEAQKWKKIVATSGATVN